MTRLIVTAHPAGGMSGRLQSEHVIGSPAGMVAARLYGQTDTVAEAVRAVLAGKVKSEPAPIVPDNPARGAEWPASAQFRAFEWLRKLATTEGAPEEAGIAFDTWHNAAMDLRAAKRDAARWHDVAERFGNTSTRSSESVLQDLGYPDDKPWLSLAEIVDAARGAGTDGAA